MVSFIYLFGSIAWKGPYLEPLSPGKGKEAATGGLVEASPALSLHTHTCLHLHLTFLRLPELCLLPSIFTASAVSGAGTGWWVRA